MKKSISKIWALVIAVVALIVICSAVFLVVTKQKSDEPVELTILHTNDIHGNVSDDEKSTIGFAKLVTYINDLRAQNDNVLVLDAGDMFQGLPFANLEKGHSVIELANAVGYDAMTVGNHEFDFGAANLFEIAGQLNYPMLAANIYTEDGERVFEPYIVKEVNGVKVGIFGIATEETAYKTHPDNVKGYVFTDMIAAAEETVKVLKETEKADVIIMLSHLGLYEGDFTSDLVAKQVDGIDVIIDGHSHTELPEGLVVNNTLIASTGTALNNVGMINIKVQKGKVTEKTAQLLSYEDFANVEPDAAVLAKINEITVQQDAALSEVIGQAAVTLEGTRGVVRTSETNLGELIADAVLNVTQADIALMNGGGIRASIEAGPITMKDVITVLPFGNTIMVKEVLGSDFIAALEHGVSEYPDEKGGFLHTAGITYTFDPSQPVGERISNVKVNGQDIDLAKAYKVAMPDFIAAGGDDFTMFAGYPVVAEYNTLMDTTAEYIKELGTVEGKFEPRMTVVTKEQVNLAA